MDTERLCFCGSGTNLFKTFILRSEDGTNNHILDEVHHCKACLQANGLYCYVHNHAHFYFADSEVSFGVTHVFYEWEPPLSFCLSCAVALIYRLGNTKMQEYAKLLKDAIFPEDMERMMGWSEFLPSDVPECEKTLFHVACQAHIWGTSMKVALSEAIKFLNKVDIVH